MTDIGSRAPRPSQRELAMSGLCWCSRRWARAPGPRLLARHECPASGKAAPTAWLSPPAPPGRPFQRWFPLVGDRDAMFLQ